MTTMPSLQRPARALAQNQTKLKVGRVPTIRPLTPSQTQAQTPANMRLLATFLVAAVLHDQVSHTIHELVSVKLSSINTQ